MCIDIDGHDSGGSSFIYVSVKKKKVKSPSLYSLTPRTRFGSANRVGQGIGV